MRNASREWRRRSRMVHSKTVNAAPPSDPVGSGTESRAFYVQAHEPEKLRVGSRLLDEQDEAARDVTFGNRHESVGVGRRLLHPSAQVVEEFLGIVEVRIVALE